MHDSIKEANRCNELHLLERTRKIKSLEVQKSYEIIPSLYQTVILDEVYKRGNKKGQHKQKTVCIEQQANYVADFIYYDANKQKTIIEDSKGIRTKDYILKRKLMKRIYCQKDDTEFLET